MSDWKQKIEAQIARERYTGKVELSLDEALALLNVAVAADTYLVDVQHDESEQALFDALDKLPEVFDE